jgi:hypothetical protein
MKGAEMNFPIPTDSSSYIWSAILVLLLPTAILAIALWITTGSVFGGESKPTAIIVYSSVAILGLGLMMSMTRSSVQITDGELIVRGSFYKRAIPLADIDRSTIAVHDEKDKPELGLRSNGVGLPGYSAGWFRTRSGVRTFAVYGGGQHVSFSTRDGVLHVVGATDGKRLMAELAPT